MGGSDGIDDALFGYESTSDPKGKYGSDTFVKHVHRFGKVEEERREDYGIKDQIFKYDQLSSRDWYLSRIFRSGGHEIDEVHVNIKRHLPQSESANASSPNGHSVVVWNDIFRSAAVGRFEQHYIASIEDFDIKAQIYDSSERGAALKSPSRTRARLNTNWPWTGPVTLLSSRRRTLPGPTRTSTAPASPHPERSSVSSRSPAAGRTNITPVLPWRATR